MRKISLLIAAGLLALTTGLTFAAPHEGNPGGNCNGFDGPNKVDTSDENIVLPAGTLVCIKAGDSNTGTLVANGTATLADLILASGLLNNGGQVPNVSNYVTYGLVTAPPTGTPVITSPPTAPPTAPPTVAPTGTPVITAPPTAVPTAAPTAAPVTAEPTLPSTDTISPTSNPTSGLWLVFAFLVSLGALAIRFARR